MSETVTINLGDRTFTVRPLTFRQAKKISEALNNPDLAPLDSNLAIIAIGLERDYKDDAANIWDLEGTLLESFEAARKVLKVAGFTPVETPAAGEAEAPKGATE